MYPQRSRNRVQTVSRLYRLEPASENRLSAGLYLLIGLALISIVLGTQVQTRAHKAETPSYIHISDQ